MPPARIVVCCLFAALFITGCATQLQPLTENYRTRIGEQDVRSLTLLLSYPMVFKSVRELDPVPEAEKHIFSQTGYRYIKVSDTSRGRVVAQGEGWLSVDFGRGIVLTFNRRDRDGVYATPGWGTYTIEGERYDIVVGILSGADIELRIKN